MLARLGLAVMHLRVHEVIEVYRAQFATVVSHHLFIVVFEHLVCFLLAAGLVLVEDLNFLGGTR